MRHSRQLNFISKIIYNRNTKNFRIFMKAAGSIPLESSLEFIIEVLSLTNYIVDN